MHNLYIYSTYYKWVYCINIVFLIYSIYIYWNARYPDLLMGQLWQGIPHLPPRRGVPYWAPTLMLGWRPWRCCRQKWRPCPRWRCAYKRCFFFWGGGEVWGEGSHEVVKELLVKPELDATYVYWFFFLSLVTAVISYKMDWCCRNVCQNFEFLPTKAMCAQCVSMELPGVWRHLYMTFFGNVRGYVEFFSIQFVWKRSSIIQCCFSESNQI